MTNTNFNDIFGNELLFGEEYICYDDRSGYTYISKGIFKGFTKTKLATLTLTSRVRVWRNGNATDDEFKPKQTLSIKPYKLIPVNKK